MLIWCGKVFTNICLFLWHLKHIFTYTRYIHHAVLFWITWIVHHIKNYEEYLYVAQYSLFLTSICTSWILNEAVKCQISFFLYILSLCPAKDWCLSIGVTGNIWKRSSSNYHYNSWNGGNSKIEHVFLEFHYQRACRIHHVLSSD